MKYTYEILYLLYVSYQIYLILILNNMFCSEGGGWTLYATKVTQSFAGWCATDVAINPQAFNNLIDANKCGRIPVTSTWTQVE